MVGQGPWQVTSESVG